MTLKGIDLEGTLLPMLKVVKVSEINFKHSDGRGRIYLEEMRSGEWRLTYTVSTIPDIKKLEALRLVREENVEDLAVTLRDITNRIDRRSAFRALHVIKDRVAALTSTWVQPNEAEAAEHLSMLTDAMAELGQAVGYGTRDYLEKEKKGGAKNENRQSPEGD